MTKQARTSIAIVLSALSWIACGDGRTGATVSVGDASDSVSDGGMAEAKIRCDVVEIGGKLQDGTLVVEKETGFTATYRMGVPYTKTVMLFGGNRVEGENKLSNAFIFALDKNDALSLAAKYPDFYLCSSPGGKEASKHIVPYDLVPATCEVYEQLVAAFVEFHAHDVAGGDRTSLRLEGAPLELQSVVANATGEDVTDQVHDQDFQLVTAVEQLTGESVLEFGTTK